MAKLKKKLIMHQGRNFLGKIEEVNAETWSNTLIKSESEIQELSNLCEL